MSEMIEKAMEIDPSIEGIAEDVWAQGGPEEFKALESFCKKIIDAK